MSRCTAPNTACADSTLTPAGQPDATGPFLTHAVAHRTGATMGVTPACAPAFVVWQRTQHTMSADARVGMRLRCSCTCAMASRQGRSPGCMTTWPFSSLISPSGAKVVPARGCAPLIYSASTHPWRCRPAQASYSHLGWEALSQVGAKSARTETDAGNAEDTLSMLWICRSLRRS